VSLAAPTACAGAHLQAYAERVDVGCRVRASRCCLFRPRRVRWWSEVCHNVKIILEISSV
jgi:hypothetical protein